MGQEEDQPVRASARSRRGSTSSKESSGSATSASPRPRPSSPAPPSRQPRRRRSSGGSGSMEGGASLPVANNTSRPLSPAPRPLGTSPRRSHVSSTSSPSHTRSGSQGRGSSPSPHDRSRSSASPPHNSPVKHQTSSSNADAVPFSLHDDYPVAEDMTSPDKHEDEDAGADTDTEADDDEYAECITEDDAAADDNDDDVPNRRPVDILDPLIELDPSQGELEESTGEVSRRIQRRAARARASWEEQQAERKKRQMQLAQEANNEAAAEATSAMVNKQRVSNDAAETTIIQQAKTSLFIDGSTSNGSVTVPTSSSSEALVSSVPHSLSSKSSSLLWSVPLEFDASFLARFYDCSKHDLYFAFGSNLNWARMQARGVHVVGGRGIPARLNGYRLAFNKTAYSLSERMLEPGAYGYASCIRIEDKEHLEEYRMYARKAPDADAVYGVLYILLKPGVEVLDLPPSNTVAAPPTPPSASSSSSSPTGQSGGLAALDVYEGVANSMYARHLLPIEIQDGTILHATTYLACESASAPRPDLLRPTPTYLSHLLAGRSMLPVQYWERLARFETSHFPDPMDNLTEAQRNELSEPSQAQDREKAKQAIMQQQNAAVAAADRNNTQAPPPAA